MFKFGLLAFAIALYATVAHADEQLPKEPTFRKEAHSFAVQTTAEPCVSGYSASGLGVVIDHNCVSRSVNTHQFCRVVYPEHDWCIPAMEQLRLDRMRGLDEWQRDLILKHALSAPESERDKRVIWNQVVKDDPIDD